MCVDLPTLGAQLTIMLFFGNMFGTFVSVIKCETGFGIVQMNPNELYTENIVTKPNVLYGVTLSTEPAGKPGTYEYVSSH